MLGLSPVNGTSHSWMRLSSIPPRPPRRQIYVTRKSLNSEPCREEVAYALDRALQTRGDAFPLIRIFPERADLTLIPGAIATLADTSQYGTLIGLNRLL